jgi:hypothetical protein
MANIIPEFRVNVPNRSVKVSKLFSFLAKPVTDTYEQSNVVYNFLCPCDEVYIGQTCRMLIHRIREHQQNSFQTNISLHISCCDAYIKNSDDFADENSNNFTSPQKAKFADKFKGGFKYKKIAKEPRLF